MRMRIWRPPVPSRPFRRRPRRADKFRQIRRLAVLAALGLIGVVTSVLLLDLWGTGAVSSPEQTARAQARFIADSILRTQLRPADLREPVTAARRRTLDRLFRTQILIDGIRLASVYGTGDRITYSTDHALIGHGTSNRSARHVLSVSVPLTGRPPAPVGALELSKTYAPPAGDGTLPFIALGAVVGLALLALRISMSPLPRHSSTDARDHTRQMQEMERRAFHDTLTGLPNRELLHRRVAQAIESAPPDGGTVAVMLMDLDRFKEINDTFGHHSGDQLLCEVAGHLSQALRAHDTVARLGGDEFAILCAPVAGPLGAVSLAERAMEHVQRSHTVAGVEVDVDASIGIALFPRHGRTVDELLRCADIAMYASKESGAPTLFAPELDHHSVARLALASQLRRAIAQRELAVYFQPKADFNTGQISSVEALVRWEHPELGLLPPDRFIPLAEQTGLIRPLTTFVLDTALEQSRAWRREGLQLAVAVNITGRDLLDQRFAEEVKDLLRKWEVMPSRLELEITENTVLTDPVRARTVLMSLHELGVRLAIDDFGSGHSSLSYLKRLPIDVLKIDKSFVLQMHDNEDDAVIVRSTIDLGHNLGLKVVAEGVSSVTAWDRLRRLGCDVAQGYYLSKPVPGPAIAELVTAEGVRGTTSHPDGGDSQGEPIPDGDETRRVAPALLSD
jgi:diguanylate cyclase (GGDEF)-like protein